LDLSPDWIVGFVDGEGCFYVGIQRHREMTVGYQLLPEFVVVQHERDAQVLHALKAYFGAGVVRSNRENRLAYRVRNLAGLDRICDFSMRHPLKTKKNTDFRKFRRVILSVKEGKHLTREGLLEAIEVARTMNTANRSALDEIRAELNGQRDGPRPSEMMEDT
jgi:hypothetical protein